MMRALVVGARSARQGTGPFIAAALAKAGVDVAAIVGTSEATVTAAQHHLKQQWQLTPRGYTDLVTALKAIQPDIVALCSPWQFHAQQLAQIAAHGSHCLVEKPLMWPAADIEVQNIITAFARSRRLLHMVSQWPLTLPQFAQLHGPLPADIHHFEMRLSPISQGDYTLPDAAPHFISLLQAMLGNGEFRQLEVSTQGQEFRQINSVYAHARGETQAVLALKTCPERPRPIWYAINGLKVSREVELPEYQQYLCAEQQRIPLPDPMESVVNAFLQALHTETPTAAAQLLAAHRNLIELNSHQLL